MSTFKLLNPPSGTTSWEVYLAGQVAEGGPSSTLELPQAEGDLVVTLFKGATPTWRWSGQSTITGDSIIEVNPQVGRVCLVTEPTETLQRNPMILVGGLVLLALVGVGRSRRRKK